MWRPCSWTHNKNHLVRGCQWKARSKALWVVKQGEVDGFWIAQLPNLAVENTILHPWNITKQMGSGSLYSGSPNSCGVSMEIHSLRGGTCHATGQYQITVLTHQHCASHSSHRAIYKFWYPMSIIKFLLVSKRNKSSCDGAKHLGTTSTGVENIPEHSWVIMDEYPWQACRPASMNKVGQMLLSFSRKTAECILPNSFFTFLDHPLRVLLTPRRCEPRWRNNRLNQVASSNFHIVSCLVYP